YARARRGEIVGFTGVDDPYEPPRNPEVRLDTINYESEENARRILALLIERGFVRPDTPLSEEQETQAALQTADLTG
ncbi:MAG: adenylyl-sulfate kinase, partial [Anaerolineales bacterium]|nr:adenylyl-sulfate kinase [Anaerolineales bacterium]